MPSDDPPPPTSEGAAPPGGTWHDFFSRSNEQLSGLLARALDPACFDRAAAMRAGDLHRHLCKLQADALAAIGAAEQGAASQEEAADSARRFFTECEVLASRPEGGGDGSGASDQGGAAPPGDEDLARFRERIRRYNSLDDEEKALRAEATKKRADKKVISSEILEFMQRHGLDDITTRQGTLRCVHRRTKAPLTRSAMADRIRTFFGQDEDAAEALRGNLFEAGEERETISLRRVVPRRRD